MRKVGAMHREKVIGLLNERLAFERSAIELYDAVLEGLKPRGGPYATVRTHLRRIREEEKAHEEWLVEQVRALGGDPTVESNGFHRVQGQGRRARDDLAGAHEPARLLHAPLDTEARDNAAWELRLELATRAQDEEACEAFAQRLHEEQEHLLMISHMAAVVARSEILDETVTTLEDASA